ncbi:hypothetical protein Gotur_029325 [Gossypium turneri]
MASYGSMTVVSSIQEVEYDDIDVGFDHFHDHQSHPHNLSSFSMSTSSTYTNFHGDDDDMGKNMSRLSIENFDVGVDEEFSIKESLLQLLSDSDKEPYCYSLPAVPPHRVLSKGAEKDCGSENEAQKGIGRKGARIRREEVIVYGYEVKACRVLGFKLEMPSRFSSFDVTSSDGTSPITNWRISGPGDDPRDVKARLKVWAQAVALASASMHCG